MEWRHKTTPARSTAGLTKPLTPAKFADFISMLGLEDADLDAKEEAGRE